MWFLEEGPSQPTHVLANTRDADWCQRVIELGLTYEATEGTVGLVNDPATRKSTVRWIKVDEASEWLYRDMTDTVMANNEAFWKFDLDYIENLQFTEYPVGAFYARHCDTKFAKDARPRKLSFGIPLTDDHKGGEFVIETNKDPIPVDLLKGQAVIFPSFIPHEVRKVTEGVRYSLVGWVRGPAWK